MATAAVGQQRQKKVDEQIITGFVSNNTPYISRLGRFTCNFEPKGTLLVCRNYDSPGKIGVVGGRLGTSGVNINFMSVAPIEKKDDGTPGGLTVNGEAAKENEALMILGVDKTPSEEVRKSLLGEDGVLEAGVVVL